MPIDTPGEYRKMGSVLAAARKRARLSQAAVAAKLKKPQSFVSSYEAGQRRVDVLELVYIAAAIDADLMLLFSELVVARGP